MPHIVYAQASCYLDDIREMGDVDTVAIVTTFPNGALGVINLSRNAPYGYDQRVEVICNK